MLAEDQIFDGHNDALTRWSSRNDDVEWTFVESAGRGHLDLPRAREGGFVGGFFAIGAWLNTDWQPRGRDFHKTEEGYFVDLAPAVDFEPSYRYCDEIFGRLERTLEESNGAVVLARNASDIELATSDTLVVIAHFEGAEAIAEDLSNLDEWYKRGLRSIGPVWSRPNAFGTGVPFAYPASPDIGPGLSDAGRELIRACDAKGIMLDLAHLNEKGFWDVAEITTNPILVTHTASHSLCPKPRNLTDRQIDAVAESGGVVGITFFSNDLKANQDPEGNATIDDIVKHIVYVAERVGVDHVALGSDFDGAPIPRDLEDAAGLPRLVNALRAAGLTGDALAKITHGNWMKAARSVLSSSRNFQHRTEANVTFHHFCKGLVGLLEFEGLGNSMPGQAPNFTNASLWQIPQASTLMRISPGPARVSAAPRIGSQRWVRSRSSISEALLS